MELQNYINSHSNYISEFKKLGFKVSTYKNLKIVSYPYNNPPNNDELWKRFCKGVVIDSNDKIINLPPVKSIEFNNINEEFNSKDDITYESLIDGTMINLFYHEDKWLISTRSEIGGYNKWMNQKSFRQMFDECSNIDYEILNKDMSYSFVMKHVENRNVSPIKNNELILVEVYHYDNDKITRLSKSQYPVNNYTINDCYQNKEEFMKLYKGPVIPYYIKGITVKCGSNRYKWINPYFDEVKDLKINMNNHLLNYIELRRNNNLKKYLRYFPEHQHLFNNYRDKVHEISNDLFTNYKNSFIHKTLEQKDIPYHLRPLVHDVHKLYLNTKKPTTWEDIKQYIHTIPSKKLVFALNYC